MLGAERQHPGPRRVCTQRSVRRANRSTGVLRNVPVRERLVLAHRPVQELQDGLPGQAVASQSNRVAAVCRVWCVHPDDIQHETIGFTGYVPVPRPASVGTAAHSRWPRHNNAVHGGLVKAFGEDGTVGDHARGARVQPLEDGPAGGERGGPIQGLRGNAGGTEGRGHGIGQGHRRRKEQGFPVRGMGLERREDLRRGVGREEQGLEFGLDQIPCWVRRASKSAWAAPGNPEVDEIAACIISSGVSDRQCGQRPAAREW